VKKAWTEGEHRPTSRLSKARAFLSMRALPVSVRASPPKFSGHASLILGARVANQAKCRTPPKELVISSCKPVKFPAAFLAPILLTFKNPGHEQVLHPTSPFIYQSRFAALNP
jgi:hypothetical protein